MSHPNITIRQRMLELLQTTGKALTRQQICDALDLDSMQLDHPFAVALRAQQIRASKDPKDARRNLYSLTQSLTDPQDPPPADGHRRCNYCGQDKPLNHVHYFQYPTGRYEKICRKCRNIRQEIAAAKRGGRRTHKAKSQTDLNNGAADIPRTVQLAPNHRRINLFDNPLKPSADRTTRSNPYAGVASSFARID